MARRECRSHACRPQVLRWHRERRGADHLPRELLSGEAGHGRSRHLVLPRAGPPRRGFVNSAGLASWHAHPADLDHHRYTLRYRVAGEDLESHCQRRPESEGRRRCAAHRGIRRPVPVRGLLGRLPIRRRLAHAVVVARPRQALRTERHGRHPRGHHPLLLPALARSLPRHLARARRRAD